jgi:molybdate transport system regulatory protein
VGESAILSVANCSEVLLALPDGQQLCATVPAQQAQDLKEAAEVTAYFNADKVILATLC